ncbi:MAG: DUF3800 domain-containing protein [Acidobacteriota bacterium]
MLPHGDFLVFVDESGDHGLDRIDPAYPVFVLAFCIVRKDHCARHLLPAVTEFKFRHFGHDQVVLHEREIRKDLGPFAILREPTRKAAFLDELTGLIEVADLTIMASVIRKDGLVGRYARPSNPYEIALGFGLERIQMWLNRRGATGTTPVVIECRGRREDNELELEFRRICSGGNFDGSQLCLEPKFVPKQANVPGLQVADLVARPIGRVVLDPAQRNRAYEVIERKLDRNPAGSIQGWGLKVFP